MTVTRVLDTPSALMCRQRLQTVVAGDVVMLAIDGDGNPGETHGIWGHVVGVSYCNGQSGLRPRYFDPNTGFFTIDDAGLIGGEVLDTLDQVYQVGAGLNIRGYTIYECTR
jgi:hypothetical protein